MRPPPEGARGCAGVPAVRPQPGSDLVSWSAACPSERRGEVMQVGKVPLQAEVTEQHVVALQCKRVGEEVVVL